ncbi:MAG: UTP--glucose-1-phosphate uridylyltransferase, partial [Patescibacteria group bacterium]
GKDGEIWIVDGINLLREQGIPVYAVEIKGGRYYDTGNKIEYMKTVVEMALSHPDINGEFKKFLKELDL